MSTRRVSGRQKSAAYNCMECNKLKQRQRASERKRKTERAKGREGASEMELTASAELSSKSISLAGGQAARRQLLQLLPMLSTASMLGVN